MIIPQQLKLYLKKEKTWKFAFLKLVSYVYQLISQINDIIFYHKSNQLNSFLRNKFIYILEHTKTNNTRRALSSLSNQFFHCDKFHQIIALHKITA